MGRLLSVNVGLPRDIAWQGKTVHTGIWKAPVEGRRMVRRLNIEGDGQGDLNGHGGERRAVLVYQTDSYRYWQNRLGRNDFAYGQFGENFTVDGLPDAEVCVGDRYRIGGALFEVTQPRVTCYRLGIRLNEPEVPALLVKHGRPGFYLRVLDEGEVEAGDEITRVASGPEHMSVSEISALLYMPGHPRDQLERALRILVLRLEPASAPALMRSYSLSGEPGAPHYRVSVKRETHGAASTYVDDELQVGDIVQASAARGSFTLRPGNTPVVLLSAGIGVTPVLAMLHALAAETPTREVWWLYGTRSGREHPFAAEVRELLEALAHHHSHICYSAPDPQDRPNIDFNSAGRLNMQVLKQLNLPCKGDFYICGPSTFMNDLTAGLVALGAAPDRIHTEMFGAGPSIT